MESQLEYALMHSHKDELISFLNAHPEFFEEAIVLAIGDQQPYSWRAAWLLWSCIAKDDARVQKYIQKIIDSIGNKKEGHQRELIKILLEMNLNSEQEGYLYDLCVSLWKQLGKKPSVRFTAFRFISTTAHKHPDLQQEINLLTQDKYMNTLSTAAKKSIRKMVKNYKT